MSHPPQDDAYNSDLFLPDQYLDDIVDNVFIPISVRAPSNGSNSANQGVNVPSTHQHSCKEFELHHVTLEQNAGSLLNNVTREGCLHNRETAEPVQVNEHMHNNTLKKDVNSIKDMISSGKNEQDAVFSESSKDIRALEITANGSDTIYHTLARQKLQKTPERGFSDNMALPNSTTKLLSSHFLEIPPLPSHGRTPDMLFRSENGSGRDLQQECFDKNPNHHQPVCQAALADEGDKPFSTDDWTNAAFHPGFKGMLEDTVKSYDLDNPFSSVPCSNNVYSAEFLREWFNPTPSKPQLVSFPIEVDESDPSTILTLSGLARR